MLSELSMEYSSLLYFVCCIGMFNVLMCCIDVLYCVLYQGVVLQVDQFEVEAVDLGALQKLVIGHDQQGEGNTSF